MTEQFCQLSTDISYTFLQCVIYWHFSTVIKSEPYLKTPNIPETRYHLWFIALYSREKNILIKMETNNKPILDKTKFNLCSKCK